MGDDRDSSAGISYRDVIVAATEAGREWCGDVRFELSAPYRPGTAVVMHATARFVPRSVGKRSTRRECAVSAPWPNGQSRTLAGLLLRLVYDLERDLEQQQLEEKRSEQTRFA